MTSQDPTHAYGTHGTSKPFLSVVIPTFRRPESLRAAIQSVVSQCPPVPLEVLVFDDDPEGTALDIARSFSTSVVHLYQNRANLGLWGNTNRALKFAKADWVVVLPDDDLLAPNAVDDFAQLLQQPRASDASCIVGGAHRLFSRASFPLRARPHSFLQYPVSVGSLSPTTLTRLDPSVPFEDTPKLCASFFLRTALRTAEGFDQACEGYADLALYLSIQQGGGLYGVLKTFGVFRVHGGNLSNSHKIWKTYPLRSARHLLRRYCAGNTPSERATVKAVGNHYVSAILRDWRDTHTRSCHRGEVIRFLGDIGLPTPWFLRVSGLVILLGGARDIARSIWRRARQSQLMHENAHHLSEEIRYL